MKIRGFLQKNQKRLWIMPVVMGTLLLVQTVRHRQGPLRVEDAPGEITLPVQVTTVRPAGATTLDDLNRTRPKTASEENRPELTASSGRF